MAHVVVKSWVKSFIISQPYMQTCHVYKDGLLGSIERYAESAPAPAAKSSNRICIDASALHRMGSSTYPSPTDSVSGIRTWSPLLTHGEFTVTHGPTALASQAGGGAAGGGAGGAVAAMVITAKISTSQIVSTVTIDREILTCAGDIGRV